MADIRNTCYINEKAYSLYRIAYSCSNGHISGILDTEGKVQ